MRRDINKFYNYSYLSRSMKKKLMDILRCPECKDELELTVEKGDDEIEEGSLYCPGCDIEYKIKGGIPDMMPHME